MVILIGIDVNKAFSKTRDEMMQPHIKSSYEYLNTNDEYHNHLSIMMVVDSFFILQFLFDHDRRACNIQIKCDILKLDNQIPLFMLKEFFDKMKEALLYPDPYGVMYDQDPVRINKLLVQKAYRELSPFDITIDDIRIDDTVENEEPHLLACIYTIVSPFLQIHYI